MMGFVGVCFSCYPSGTDAGDVPTREWQVSMKVRIASDVGGTFTDSIAYDPQSRRIAVSKVPTTPQARDVGTVEGLRGALQQLGLTGSCRCLRRPRHDDGHQRRHPAQRRQDRLRHQPRLQGPAADRPAGSSEPLRHRRRADAAAGAARAVLRHRRSPRCDRQRDSSLSTAISCCRPRPTCAPRVWRPWRSPSCTPTPIPCTSAPPGHCWRSICRASRSASRPTSCASSASSSAPARPCSTHS